MHVALVAPEYRHGPNGQGGVAAVTDSLAALLHRAGWRVDVHSVRMSSQAQESRRLTAPSSWFRALQPVDRTDGGPGVSVGAHLAELEAVRYLPRKCLDDRLNAADLVLLVAGTPAFAHVARRTTKPVVLQVATTLELERSHRQDLATFTARDVARLLMTKVVSRMDSSGLDVPDLVVTENDFMTAHVRSHGARRVEQCPPGVDTSTFTPPPGPSAQRHLLTVARLADRRKDLMTMVGAYAVARRQGCRLPLVLAGRGEVPRDVADQVATLGLTDHVLVRSDVDQRELIELLQSAALFLSSSTEEGLGIAAIEAMSCGAPVLGTATEGTKTLLADTEAGQVVAIGDAAALGHAIVDWLADEDRRARGRTAARRRAVDVFSSQATDCRWIQLLSEVAATGEA